MTTVPQPVAAVLQRGLHIREFRAWPDTGLVFLDTPTPLEPESELVQAICKNGDAVLQIQDAAWDAVANSAGTGAELDYMLAACLIGDSLIIAACLIPAEAEAEAEK
jgi:hypothetical protein